MGDQELVKRLKHSTQEWNIWRQEHPEIQPNLRGAYIRTINFTSAEFTSADFTSVDLRGTNLRGANFSGADFTSADLSSTDLNSADLSGANLSSANLSGANLSSANLSSANLSSANLSGANLNGTYLSGANFKGTIFAYTIFAWVDLSNTKELETAIHLGPSVLDINSVTLPHDESNRLYFLRDVGFTETQIDYLPSLLTPRPIQYQSLFISYASQDDTIARQLYADLRKKDVPCWFAPHNLKPGDFFREEIDKAIHTHEKLLLIFSKHSVTSKWVKYEVNRALNREIEQEHKILYPIRVDDTVLSSTSDWAADLRAHRHIGDFTSWQNTSAYQEALLILLQHLKVSTPPTR